VLSLFIYSVEFILFSLLHPPSSNSLLRFFFFSFFFSFVFDFHFYFDNRCSQVQWKGISRYIIIQREIGGANPYADLRVIREIIANVISL
jgi:hypothetical protein